MAWTIGANCRPESFEQFKSWVHFFMPQGKNFHFVGLAAICWAIWKLKNRKCFEGKLLRSPTELVCYACVFINYWSGLQKEEDKSQLMAGGKVLQQNAIAVHPKQSEDQAGKLMIKGPEN